MQREFALAFFALLALAAGVFLLRWFRRAPYGPVESVLYLLSLLLVRVLWRAQVDPLPLAADQGAVIVANHRSSIDPFFIQSVANRYVHWMVAREYCEHPLFRWFLRRVRAIPTGRGGQDTAATKEAIRCAARGELVGMFPEGRINKSDQLLLPVRPGAVMVALRASVPIVPCYIEGSPYGGTVWSPLLMPARVRVKFGQPIDLQDRFGEVAGGSRQDAILLDVVSAMARLAGCESFQPRLAGRRWLHEDDPPR